MSWGPCGQWQGLGTVIGPDVSTPLAVTRFLDTNGRWLDESVGVLVTDAGDLVTPYVGFGGGSNLLLWSQDFANAAWTDPGGTTTVSKGTTGPDGLPADVVNWTTSGLGLRQAVTLTDSATYTFSVWARLLADTSGGVVSIDLGDGTAGFFTATATWQRFVLTLVAGSSDWVDFLHDGTSDFGFWGAQLEVGSTAGTYVPTGAGAVTVPVRGVVVPGTAWLPVNVVVTSSYTNPHDDTRVYVESLAGSDNPVVDFRESSSGGSGARRILRCRFENNGSIGVGTDWIQFEDSGGEVGRIHSEVVYATFTGAHESQTTGTSALVDATAHDRLKEGDDDREWTPGMVVSSTGVLLTDRMSRALPTIRLADAARDPAVMGVYTGARWPHNVSGFDRDKPAISYNALGEGMVLVTDVNGPVQLGDYITSSEVLGHGQRQDDDVLHSFTVAKCTQTVDWATVPDTVDVAGQKLKRTLVSCTYHCG